MKCTYCKNEHEAIDVICPYVKHPKGFIDSDTDFPVKHNPMPDIKREPLSPLIGFNKEWAKEFKDYVSKRLVYGFYKKTIRPKGKSTVKIIRAVKKYQHKYVKSGNEVDLEPMTLKELSSTINLDPAYIWRIASKERIAVRGKSIRLIHLFCKAQNLNSTSYRIRQLISEIVENENKENPFSDADIAMRLFHKNNIKIARRTVDKYRSFERIPNSHDRKVKSQIHFYQETSSL